MLLIFIKEFAVLHLVNTDGTHIPYELSYKWVSLILEEEAIGFLSAVKLNQLRISWQEQVRAVFLIRKAA